MCRRRAGAAVGLFLLAFAAGCSSPLGRQYEYEEQIYLSVDGSATVVVDSSIPALVALRGAPFDPSMKAGVNRERVRDWFESSGCQNVRVGQPWLRRGRRFVQIRMAVEDIRALSACGPLAWSRYQFERDQQSIHFLQDVGAASDLDPGTVNWDGTELVGFKLHAPSRIFYHNVRRLEDGSTGDADRGNILTWEQTLTDRRAGTPLRLEVRMGSESILLQTLSLFAMAFTTAVAAIALVIWVTVRRARRRNAASGQV
jgi:hypothetical protein